MRLRRGSRRLGTAVAALAAAIVLAVLAERFYVSDWTTASLAAALASLLLCCLVVYLSTPHVLRWSRQRQWPLPWSYRITAQGLVFVLAVVVVGTTALSSGNNLIYLVLSAMLAAILVSGLVSRLVLSGLQLQVSLPENLFASQPALAQVRLRNLKRWLPSFSLWIGAPSTRQDPSEMQLQPAYCPMIGGRREVRPLIEARFPRRGLYQNQQVWLRTLFPFSFVERRARLDLTQDFIAYPNVELTAEAREVVRGIERQWRLQDRGDSHDLYRIRPALPEDGARFLDWKAAARAGGLWVREYTREDYKRARLVFDRALPAGESEESFERAVELCAAVAWWLDENGVLIDFSSDDFALTAQPSRSSIHQILRYLALVHPNPATETDWLTENVRGNHSSGQPVVIGVAPQTAGATSERFYTHPQ